MLLFIFFLQNSYLELVERATSIVLPATASNAVLTKKDRSVCFALKIDLQLVLFHSICRTLNLSSERWRAVQLLCLLCWVGGGCGCNSTDFRARIAPSFVYFVFFAALHLQTLSSLSILLQHYGAGAVKLLQPRNQIKKILSYSGTWSNDY